MKKNSSRLITVFAAITILGTVPMQAEESPTKKAKQQFNESISRFKKCVFKLDCTKWEALKLGRDLTIAAGLVIAAMYGAGTALQRGARKAPVGYTAKRKIWQAGTMLQKPGQPFMKAGTRAAQVGQRGVEAAAKWGAEQGEAAMEKLSPSPLTKTGEPSPDYIMRQQRSKR